MLQGFPVGSEKGGMEDRMNLPLGRNAEVEGCVGDDFFHLEGTSSLYLEFSWSIHGEVGCFEPHLISNSPGCELGGYSFLHFLLGYLMGSLGVITSSG